MASIPEPDTDEMVTFLHASLHNCLCEVQQMFDFTRGDAMAACLHIIVDTGLERAVPDRLRADVIEAIDRLLVDFVRKQQKAN